MPFSKIRSLLQNVDHIATRCTVEFTRQGFPDESSSVLSCILEEASLLCTGILSALVCRAGCPLDMTERGLCSLTLPLHPTPFRPQSSGPQWPPFSPAYSQRHIVPAVPSAWNALPFCLHLVNSSSSFLSLLSHASLHQGSIP